MVSFYKTRSASFCTRFGQKRYIFTGALIIRSSVVQFSRCAALEERLKNSCLKTMVDTLLFTFYDCTLQRACARLYKSHEAEKLIVTLTPWSHVPPRLRGESGYILSPHLSRIVKHIKLQLFSILPPRLIGLPEPYGLELTNVCQTNSCSRFGHSLLRTL